VIDEELEEVEDDEEGEEGVEVDVEGEAPLHVLVPAPRLHQEPIAQKPQSCSNDHPHGDEVDEHHVQQELDEPPEVDAKA